MQNTFDKQSDRVGLNIVSEHIKANESFSEIAYCDCGYAADTEKATSKDHDYVGQSEGELKKVYTP